MSNEKIEFKFDNVISVLSGNDFGRETFKKQMKGKFDMNKVNELVFPDKIDVISSSFVQGLFSEFLNKYTPDEIASHISIGNTDHLSDIIDGLKE